MVVPAEENPILESLISIRMSLTALKKDRTGYIRAHDVLTIYNRVMDEVLKLNDIRANAATPKASALPSLETLSIADTPADPSPSTSTLLPASVVPSPHPPATPVPGQTGTQVREDNRVDTILNDVFQLLSLFFLRIGKSRESPATFCQLTGMKRLLMHLNESGIYTESDLRPFRSRLNELKEIIMGSTDAGGSDPREKGLLKLLFSKYDACERLLSKLSGALNRLSPELAPLHQRLITLRRTLTSVLAKPHPKVSDVTNVMKELRDIEERRVDGGKFLGTIDGEVGGEPTDVPPPEGQELLAGLLEVNFEIFQDIQAKQGEEEVARGPLQPIYDRLTEIRAQLERLVLTHRWTLRETDLYNFQMALSAIDATRVEGKFRDAQGNIPEGQRVLLYLLRRCYGLCWRLMASSEPISEELMPIANKLTTVKRCLLEVQKFGGPYSPFDLYPYQLALKEIDDLRKDGKFVGVDGGIPEGQAILNALLSEAHEIVYEMREEGQELGRGESTDDDDGEEDED